MSPDFKVAIRERIKEKLSGIFLPGARPKDHKSGLRIRSKPDNSMVTAIDTFVSETVHEEVQKAFGGKYTFISEEDDARGELRFPAAILDPIDGTRELVKGVPECALSLALMDSANMDAPGNWGWIYNPFTGLELDSSSLMTQAPNFEHTRILGLVSRSEWNRGLSEFQLPSDIALAPRGSIAFKLALLAGGACDFVVSMRPKNLWDIAAGTILCQARGIQLYGAQGVLDGPAVMTYDGPLLWCPPVLKDKLQQAFHWPSGQK